MFDIGWSEMAVIAVIALIVLGPKELPNALKTAAQWMRTARKLAREFQSGVDQIVREAELDEARKTVQQATKLNLGKEIEKTVDPTGETKRALNEAPGKPAIASTPPADTAADGTRTPTPVSNQLAAPSAAVSSPAPSAPPSSPSQPEPASSASGDNRA